jgi:hypothetical protein
MSLLGGLLGPDRPQVMAAWLISSKSIKFVECNTETDESCIWPMPRRLGPALPFAARTDLSSRFRPWGVPPGRPAVSAPSRRSTARGASAGGPGASRARRQLVRRSGVAHRAISDSCDDPRPSSLIRLRSRRHQARPRQSCALTARRP